MEKTTGSEKLALFLILALGLVLRLAGIQFGLPHLYHADEPIVVNHALAYGSGDFHPHFFKIPPLTSYFLFFLYGLAFLIGKLFSLFPTAAAYEALFLKDPTFFYLLGRILLGAFAGILTFLCLYRTIAKHVNSKVALLSAFFLATCFLHVRDSHYIYADIPLLFILVASLGVFWKAYDRSFSTRDSILCGVMIGLAIAVKYNGFAIAVIPVILAIRKSAWKAIAIGLVSSVFTFALLNPYAFLDFSFFLQELQQESRAHGGISWLHHLTYSLAGGFSAPLLLLSFAGMFRANADAKRQSLALFLVMYYLLLIAGGQHYDRYVLPLIPFLCFFAADFLDTFRGSTVTLWAIAIFFALPNLTKSIQFDHVMMTEDVRTQAKAWVEENIPPGSKVALAQTFFSPRLRFSHEQLEAKKASASALQLRRIEAMELDPSTARYALFFLSDSDQNFFFNQPTIPYNLEALKVQGIEYVILPRFRPEEDLLPGLELVARFTPYKKAEQLWPVDPQPLTGGPFLWRELINRKSNGVPIAIYKLK